MNCPQCNNDRYDDHHICAECGFDLSTSDWVVIARVLPPDDALLESLIQSFGIPVRLVRESIGSVFSLTIGPLGEVKVVVPEFCAEQARLLLQATPEEAKD